MKSWFYCGNEFKRLQRQIVKLCPYLVAAGLSMGMQAGTAASPRLDLGDPAPELHPAKWLKGAPITGFQTGQVYVVEFWATWCGPCKANIPHLTELAKKYRDQVTIAGISIWESADPTDLAYLQKVEDFVRHQGDKMDYRVAVDGPQGEIAKAWMAAAGEGGIPASFIVGKDGRIAWIGYPANLDEVLQQVLAGKFDVAAARHRRDVDLSVVRPLNEAMAANDFKRAGSVLEVALQLNPHNHALTMTYAFKPMARKTASKSRRRSSSVKSRPKRLPRRNSAPKLRMDWISASSTCRGRRNAGIP